MPGKGHVYLKETVAQPYATIADWLPRLEPCIHIIDFHAESTSEKHLFAYAVEGKVSAVLGTHTHVATADARILEGGTAYQTDVGMVGLRDGSIGASKESAVDHFVRGYRNPLDFNAHGLCQFNAVILDIDEQTYQTKNIERVYFEEVIE